jgi:hypothetical protein
MWRFPHHQHIHPLHWSLPSRNSSPQARTMTTRRPMPTAIVSKPRRQNRSDRFMTSHQGGRCHVSRVVSCATGYGPRRSSHRSPACNSASHPPRGTPPGRLGQGRQGTAPQGGASPLPTGRAAPSRSTPTSTPSGSCAIEQAVPTP